LIQIHIRNPGNDYRSETEAEIFLKRGVVENQEPIIEKNSGYRGT